MSATGGSAPSWGRAVVIGGGVSGLLACRALSERFGSVVLVEPDVLPDEAVHRKGTPQGRHVHGFLARGLTVIDHLFPGIADELVADGAVRIDWGADLRWYYFDDYKPMEHTGTAVVMFSRPFLEAHLARRVRAIPNVALHEGVRVERLAATPDGSRITGVILAPMPGSDVGETLEADLVVDASGRGSRTPAWLRDMGYPEPKSSEIGIDLSYTSRYYRRGPDDLPDAKVVYIVPTPPAERRGGAALPVDGDRWLVTLFGYFGDEAPVDDPGYLDFASRLPAPDIHDLISRLEPLSAPVVYRIPKSVRRHYESVPRFPERLVVIGDAMCGFNPVFAQGMTVAVLEADALMGDLDDVARRGGALDGFGRRFHRHEASIISLPWRMASNEDFRYPDTRGRKELGAGFLNWYVGRVHRASVRDLSVYRAYLRAMHMTRSPFTLFDPRIMVRVLARR